MALPDLSKTRYWVRIRAGKSQGMSECIYYRNGLSFNILMKWMWYFEYRSSLYVVKFPKHFCRLEHGSYDYVPRVDHELKRIKDLIQNRKAHISKIENNISRVEAGWQQLFSITEEPGYKEAIKKINSLRVELAEFITYQDALLKKEAAPVPKRLENENEVTCIDKRI